MYTMAELLQAINQLRSNGLSWGGIAEKLYPFEDRDAIKPVLYRIAMEMYYPKGDKLRTRLGLPRTVMVEVCPDCGEVHLAVCPNQEPTKLHAPSITAVTPNGCTIAPGTLVSFSSKPCSVCGRSFLPRVPNAVCCSPECRAKRKHEQRKRAIANRVEM
jgi:hypothetical protein